MFPGVFGYLEWISHTDGSRPRVSIVSRYQQVLHIWLISRAWIASRSTKPNGVLRVLSLNLTCFFLHLTIDDRNERDKLPLYSPHKAKGKSQFFRK
jgi:hypothetical protein